LDIDEYIYVFNNFISNGLYENKISISSLPLDSLKTLMCSKKGGILSTMKSLGLKECIFLTWLMIFENETRCYKDVRANPFKEGEYDAEHNLKISL